MMTDITEIASGLRFPEGPVALPDGSIVLVEIERQTLSRVRPNGEVSVIAELGGGPNGAAIGPGDLVFDAHGGFWFTDLGKTRLRDMDRGFICYAKAVTRGKPAGRGWMACY